MVPVKSIEQYSLDNVLGFSAAIQMASDIKDKGKTVGLCHGRFDLLHPGHIRHFFSAKSLCDCLFVSVTSDRFVTSLKGGGRPIFSDKLRAYSIAALRCVGYVTISDFEKGTEIISLLKPNYYIKGPDYINLKTSALLEEIKVLETVGGKMLYTQDIKQSTTEIIDYIKRYC